MILERHRLASNLVVRPLACNELQDIRARATTQTTDEIAASTVRDTCACLTLSQKEYKKLTIQLKQDI